MRVRAVGDRRIVHLIDRTGSYTSERIRVDFVANASHELRTPLASLLGYVETLRDEAGEDPETRRRFLKIMFDEARRMQRLIEDLISLSRIEAEKYRAPDQSVDLGALIEEVRSELSASAEPRADDLSLDLAEVPPVRGDRAQLSQLLHNIVGNAMKYGREGTPVTIALKPGNDAMVRVTVSDEGGGHRARPYPAPHRAILTASIRGAAARWAAPGWGSRSPSTSSSATAAVSDIASSVGKGTTVTILLPAYRLS
ncbi:MAG: histidine kinase dimerization/phospho-acceptor domain-containing protein [Sphingomonas sp.]